MNCPNCGGKTRTIDSRDRDEGNMTYRRRECRKCGERFTTFEIAEENLARNDVKIAK